MRFLKQCSPEWSALQPHGRVLRHVMQDGVNGYTVPVGDSDAGAEIKNSFFVADNDAVKKAGIAQV